MKIEAHKASNVYTYCRLTPGSTAKEQLRAIEAVGLPIDHERVTTESVFASTPTDRRPAFMQLLQLLEPGDSLLVAGIDALGRNAGEIVQILNLLGSAKISVYCPMLGKNDLASPEGGTARQAFEAIAACESLIAAEQARKGSARPRKVMSQPSKTKREAASRSLCKGTMTNVGPAQASSSNSSRPTQPAESVDENERAMSIPLKDAPRHAIEAVAMMGNDAGEK